MIKLTQYTAVTIYADTPCMYYTSEIPWQKYDCTYFCWEEPDLYAGA